jgi:hypothetical protein
MAGCAAKTGFSLVAFPRWQSACLTAKLPT